MAYQSTTKKIVEGTWSHSKNKRKKVQHDDDEDVEMPDVRQDKKPSSFKTAYTKLVGNRSTNFVTLVFSAKTTLKRVNLCERENVSHLGTFILRK
jgi:hypothetical protein